MFVFLTTSVISWVHLECRLPWYILGIFWVQPSAELVVLLFSILRLTFSVFITAGKLLPGCARQFSFIISSNVMLFAFFESWAVSKSRGNPALESCGFYGLRAVIGVAIAAAVSNQETPPGHFHRIMQISSGCLGMGSPWDILGWFTVVIGVGCCKSVLGVVFRHRVQVNTRCLYLNTVSATVIFVTVLLKHEECRNFEVNVTLCGNSFFLSFEFKQHIYRFVCVYYTDIYVAPRKFWRLRLKIAYLLSL